MVRVASSLAAGEDAELEAGTGRAAWRFAPDEEEIR
jgi:hypothetical protein